MPSVLSPSEQFSPDAGQGTEDRLKNLRKSIVARDGGRCVVSGCMDMGARSLNPNLPTLGFWSKATAKL
jgi:hypothetical protein